MKGHWQTRTPSSQTRTKHTPPVDISTHYPDLASPCIQGREGGCENSQSYGTTAPYEILCPVYDTQHTEAFATHGSSSATHGSNTRLVHTPNAPAWATPHHTSHRSSTSSKHLKCRKSPSQRVESIYIQ